MMRVSLLIVAKGQNFYTLHLFLSKPSNLLDTLRTNSSLETLRPVIKLFYLASIGRRFLYLVMVFDSKRQRSQGTG